MSFGGSSSHDSRHGGERRRGDDVHQQRSGRRRRNRHRSGGSARRALRNAPAAGDRDGARRDRSVRVARAGLAHACAAVRTLGFHASPGTRHRRRRPHEWIGSPGDPVACLAAGRVATQIIRRRAAVTVAHGAQLRAGLARQASTRAGCRTGSCRSSVGHAGWRSGGNAGNDSGCTASRSGSWSRSPASPASPARHRPGLGRTRRRVAHSRR